MNIIKDKNSVYVLDEKKEKRAYVTFPDIDKDTVLIDHTFVGDEFRGQGLAGILMENAYEVIKEQNKKATLKCSYAIKWFEKNPDKNDILK